MSNPNLQKTAGILFRIFKYISLAGLLICLYGLGLSVRENYPLWVDPIHAEGTIVRYETVSWESRRAYAGSLTTPSSANLPVVEFRNGEGSAIQFTDHRGHSILQTGAHVPVIYAKDDPSNAVIDKGALGWFDTYIWLFGVIAFSLGLHRFNRAGCDSA